MIEPIGTVKIISVEIASNREIAPAWFRMVLTGPGDDFQPQPGQFVLIRIGEGYDPLLRRSFGIFRVQKSGGVELEILYQVVGRGTTLMSRLLPGTGVELQGPLGRPYRIPPGLISAFVVAGGIGIAPLRGLVHHLVALKVPDLRVFLGARSAPYLFLRPELTGLGVAVEVATDDGSEGFFGLVTDQFEEFLQDVGFQPTDRAACFACGPMAMLPVLAGISSRYGLPTQVSLEARMACGIGACLGCVVPLRQPDSSTNAPPYGRVCVDGPVFEVEEIAW